MEFRVGFHVKTLSNLIKKDIDFFSRKKGITGFQGYLIGYLIREGEKRDVFQRDVEKKMEISRASVTNVLQLLEKNGFIRRESVDYDARLKKIVVTDKGISVNEETLAMLDQVERTLTFGIEAQRLQIFMEVLDQMKQNLEESMERKNMCLEEERSKEQC